MAKKETNISQWVDERLSALDSGGDWRPNADQGLARLRERRRTARRRTIEWIVASFAGVAACAALMVFSSPGACARPNSCSNDPARPAAPVVAESAPASVPAPAAAQAPAPAPAAKTDVAKAPAAAQPAVSVPAYKVSGLPNAPIVCEVYTDFECPSCAMLYKDTIPVLMEQYVNKGKMKLVHRDFPLPQHPYARLAARYANAAGIIGQSGQYEAVVKQLFQTQTTWSRDGNVDAQVMQVVPPGAMQRVREMVLNDAHLDDTVIADMGLGVSDHLDSTPTLIFVVGGKRQPVTGVPNLAILKKYFDQLLQAH